MIDAFNKLDAAVTLRVINVFKVTTTRDFLIASFFLLVIWLFGWQANEIGQWVDHILNLQHDVDTPEKIFWRRICVSFFCFCGQLTIVFQYWLNVVRPYLIKSN